jgi:hypothetical protein
VEPSLGIQRFDLEQAEHVDPENNQDYATDTHYDSCLRVQDLPDRSRGCAHGGENDRKAKHEQS